MTIVTNANLHLWLLTGRYEKFVGSALNAGVFYKSSSPPAEVTELRQLLQLDDTRSDFYVRGALAAAKASAPLLRNLPEDGCIAFTSALTAPPPVTVVGATALSPDATRMATLSGKVAGRKGFTSLQVRRHGAGAQISSNNGQTLFAEFTIFNNILTIPALLEFGIDARFQVSGWVEGQTFSINLAQTHYPYDKFAAEIADSYTATQLMLQEGTMEAFASSAQALHKVGALACAIMLRMATLIAANKIELVVDIPSAPGVGVDVVYDAQLFFDGAPIFYNSDPVTYEPA